ncbi:MAG: nucleotide pyrophosphohydrolase [Bacillota bacterium]|nr:nucleotide pyrophosphohydrolase [Bacillota bacterium]
MKEVRDKLREFNKERDWEQFHTPENLAKSIAIEAGELLECFQWSGKFDKSKVSEELADVLSYCIMLADELDVDPEDILLAKIEQNAEKYPVEKAKGSSRKYDEL